MKMNGRMKLTLPDASFRKSQANSSRVLREVEQALKFS